MSGCEQFRPQGLCCVDDIESMYLRDLFAAMVMDSCFEHSTTREEAAKKAYMEADAMMKAREAKHAEAD